jgi:hypothetical protein
LVRLYRFLVDTHASFSDFKETGIAFIAHHGLGAPVSNDVLKPIKDGLSGLCILFGLLWVEANHITAPINIDLLDKEIRGLFLVTACPRKYLFGHFLIFAHPAAQDIVKGGLLMFGQELDTPFGDHTPIGYHDHSTNLESLPKLPNGLLKGLDVRRVSRKPARLAVRQAGIDLWIFAS